MDSNLNACIKGDKRGWDTFVSRWSPVIYAAVERTIQNRIAGTGGTRGDCEAEDIAQKVFFRLIKDDFHLLKSFDNERSSLSTWLTLIARSVTIDHLRRRKLPTVPLENTDAAASSSEKLDVPDIPLHQLSSRQRLVIHLLFEREMTVREAAVLLKIDEQTVRSTKHKALNRLREHFDSPNPELSQIEGDIQPIPPV